MMEMESENQPIVDRNEEEASKCRDLVKFKLFLGTALTFLSTIFAACALTCLQTSSYPGWIKVSTCGNYPHIVSHLYQISHLACV